MFSYSFKDVSHSSGTVWYWSHTVLYFYAHAVCYNWSHTVLGWFHPVWYWSRTVCHLSPGISLLLSGHEQSGLGLLLSCFCLFQSGIGSVQSGIGSVQSVIRLLLSGSGLISLSGNCLVYSVQFVSGLIQSGLDSYSRIVLKKSGFSSIVSGIGLLPSGNMINCDNLVLVHDVYQLNHILTAPIRLHFLRNYI